ncbi:MAG: TonB-dependent siderophore receptor [Cyanobacteria bacterium P01_D01_bin.56]
MVSIWVKCNCWSIQLTVALWLLLGQGSLAEDVVKTDMNATAADRLTQIAQAELVEITNVQVELTDAGLTLRLETTGELTVPETSVAGDAVIAAIPNATLNLPDGDSFFVSNPTEGIALIDISSLPDNRVQIAITGTDAPPSLELENTAAGIIASVNPGDPTVQTPDSDSLRIVVTGEDENDYFVPNASTATRTDTPLRDIPQSIQVIPRQVIEDQQAIELDEVLTNVSGVTASSTQGNFQERFTVRGFGDTPVLRDGFRQFGFLGQSFAETANLEQVEVLKGPASILYGEIEPGGVINLVTKKPLEEGSLYEATLRFGNDVLISPQIDFSDALTADGRVRYRLNALYRHENSFRNFETDFERFFIAPVISWEIGDRTDITFQLDYTDDEAPVDTGLPAQGDGIFDISFDSIITQNDTVVESELINVGYDLEHRFSDNWTLRNAFRFSERNLDVAGGLSAAVDEETGIGPQSFAAADDRARNYTLQTNLIGKFDTGSVKHTLLFGVDLNRTDDFNLTRFDFANPVPFNIFDPVFGVFDDIDIDDVPIFRNNDIQSDRLGIFLQDQVDILDNLILLAGLRYDTIEQTTVAGPTAFSPEISETTQNDDDFTPRVGLVYQPIPEISLFGSYSQSFTPNSATDSSGDPLGPEQGEGFEFGVKAELLEDRLFATLAYFDITKQNVATPDPDDMFSSVATGEQKSQGIEFDLIGEILPGWNIVASYAYIDAEVSEDNTDIVGNRLFNTPEHSASLWTTYEIQHGNLQGLGFGGGFVFVDERQGDLANSFTADSYFLTNAALFYRRDNWRVALNFNNLFDVDYISATNNSRGFNNDVGDPFEVRASVSVEF